MKKLFLTFTLMLTLVLVYAQHYGELSFVSDNEDKFYVLLNGQIQNLDAKDRVKIKYLKPANYKINIIFENAAYKELKTEITTLSGTELVYHVARNDNFFDKTVPLAEKNKFYSHKLNLFTKQSLGAAPVTMEQLGQTKTSNLSAVYGNKKVVNPNETQVVEMVLQQEPKAPKPETKTTNTVQIDKEAKCTPIHFYEFSKALNTISAKNEPSAKLYAAKQVIADKCLTATQIKQVILKLGNEKNRLDYAKYAYKNCADKQNYSAVYDAFKLESSIEQLKKLIN